ncbi:phosphoribosylglycinamide formyltransferase [Faecalispora anaeroviscerum]|uniref:phosphoribosylglycinamide formyltransferase n=1 Tax=Faecalispora anaeroviscerum TaxID=2991836 RepID=UPI0024BB6F3C|nr:phosphoribosylglycinamide formyltransferase [Faecalispora anaeroviscerum]
MLNIVVLVSGGGTNLQALIDAERRGELSGGRLSCVISSRPDAYALTRAAQAGVPCEVLRRKEFDSQSAYDHALLALLERCKADLVVLAGFMTIIGDEVIARYRNRMMNIHPSLIPSFCGEGYFGLGVHRAALLRGVRVTGATVHFVNEVCDGGPIILQTAVEIRDDDTPETLQKRVMEEAEWKILPRAVSLFCEGRLSVAGNRVLQINKEQREEAE